MLRANVKAPKTILSFFKAKTQDEIEVDNLKNEQIVNKLKAAQAKRNEEDLETARLANRLIYLDQSEDEDDDGDGDGDGVGGRRRRS